MRKRDDGIHIIPMTNPGERLYNLWLFSINYIFSFNGTIWGITQTFVSHFTESWIHYSRKWKFYFRWKLYAWSLFHQRKGNFFYIFSSRCVHNFHIFCDNLATLLMRLLESCRPTDIILRNLKYIYLLFASAALNCM